MSGPDLSEPQLSDVGSWNRDRLPPVPKWVGALVLVVVILGIGAWLIAQALSSSSPKPKKRSSSPTATYVTFKDPAGAFEIGYPRTWARVPTASSQYALLAEGPDGASYEVATTKLTAPVTAANLSAAEPLATRVLKQGKDVKLLKTRYRQPIVASNLLGGLPGLLYIYTFKATNGEMGAHAHYFVFNGKELITLVFQVLPSTNFVSLSHLFDQIATTFHVIPSSP
jgi:hypothetical protein